MSSFPRTEVLFWIYPQRSAVIGPRHHGHWSMIFWPIMHIYWPVVSNLILGLKAEGVVHSICYVVNEWQACLVTVLYLTLQIANCPPMDTAIYSFKWLTLSGLPFIQSVKRLNKMNIKSVTRKMIALLIKKYTFSKFVNCVLFYIFCAIKSLHMYIEIYLIHFKNLHLPKGQGWEIYSPHVIDLSYLVQDRFPFDQCHTWW